MAKFSPALIALESRAPRIGVPFLEAFRVHAGPPGLLGRFFLTADTRLRERGITLKFITFEHLMAVRDSNKDNWGSMNPMFDPRVADIPPGSMCFAGFDRHGAIKACICAKPFDATTQSLTSIIDAGGLYSIKPGRNATGLATQVATPFPEEVRGMIGFAAAVWVHPDRRGDRLASIFTNLMNACILTLWDPDYVTAMIARATQSTELFQRYNFPVSPSSVSVTSGGKPLVELGFLWMSADDTAVALNRYLDRMWPEIDAAVAARDRQQSA